MFAAAAAVVVGRLVVVPGMKGHHRCSGLGLKRWIGEQNGLRLRKHVVCRGQGVGGFGILCRRIGIRG